MAAQYYICSCYFSRNIFLQRFKLHVSFHNEQQFAEDYRQVLREKGCRSDEEWGAVLEEVKTELSRRRSRGHEHVHRSQLITKHYHRLHPSLYTISDSYFDPQFLEIVEFCCSPAASIDGLTELLVEDVPNVFSFPVFSRAFCQQFLEEMDHFEQSELPKGRPNTMNNYGILLSEMGFDDGFMDRLRKDYLMPVAQLLFPEWVGKGLDSHRAFIVKYAMGEDLELSYHYDNAEVTLNVCLGKIFKGGELYFGPMKGELPLLGDFPTYNHVLGRGILHRARHMHGARSISGGERCNLIVWMRSSSVRNKLCPMCNSPPELVVQEGYGDGFTRERQEVPVLEPCSLV